MLKNRSSDHRYSLSISIRYTNSLPWLVDITHTYAFAVLTTHCFELSAIFSCRRNIIFHVPIARVYRIGTPYSHPKTLAGPKTHSRHGIIDELNSFSARMTCGFSSLVEKFGTGPKTDAISPSFPNSFTILSPALGPFLLLSGRVLFHSGF